MGDYDLPAEISYVLEKTGKEKLAYIGHSQGTTQLFYALSHNEEFFKDKISVFIALGPVTELSNCNSNLIRAAS